MRYPHEGPQAIWWQSHGQGPGPLTYPSSSHEVLWCHWDFYTYGGTVSTSRLCGTPSPLSDTKPSSSGSKANVPRTTSVSTRFPQVRKPTTGGENNGTYYSVGARTRGDVSHQTSAYYSCPSCHCAWGTSWGHCPDLSLFHPPNHPPSWSSSSVNEQLGQMNG